MITTPSRSNIRECIEVMSQLVMEENVENGLVFIEGD